MLKMADKTIAFVQKTLDYAQLNFAFVPAFLDLKEFGKPRPYIAQTYTNLETALTDVTRCDFSAGLQARAAFKPRWGSEFAEHR